MDASTVLHVVYNTRVVKSSPVNLANTIYVINVVPFLKEAQETYVIVVVMVTVWIRYIETGFPKSFSIFRYGMILLIQGRCMFLSVHQRTSTPVLAPHYRNASVNHVI